MAATLVLDQQVIDEHYPHNTISSRLASIASALVKLIPPQRGVSCHKRFGIKEPGEVKCAMSQ
jgi:hypothetical protein